MRAALISVLSAILLAGPARAVEPKPAPADGGAKIKWQQWSDSLFEKAKSEHKLVLLDLEAVWCHWCHVMDVQTYSDPQVAREINQHFIPVQVDQDSRPDLSNKYEDYGWPATIIFSSDGKELVKRSGFIAPDEMNALLRKISKNPVAEETADAGIKEYATAGALGTALRKELNEKHVRGYDTTAGAWSHGQKFLEADSVEYALARAKAGDARESRMARQTLDQQLHLLDPVWGGMYQYSTHDDWVHPHFEKIMSVQSDNLRVYSLAYELYGDAKYLQAAKSIASYMQKFLLSPEGAFYTSQDADLVAGKHSDTYFKLSDAQRRKQGIPRIDRHEYARENGWAVSGLVALYQACGDRQYLDAALKAADWICTKRALSNGGYSHDVKDAGGPFLGDTLYPARAFLALYQATGDKLWLNRAEQSADFIAAHFQQAENKPGFLTAEPRQGAIAQPVALLDENVAAARFFNLLNRCDGKTEYKSLAQSAMRYLATPAIAHQRSVFVAGLLLADRELATDPVHITISGGKSDPQALVLYKQALRYPVSYKLVEWYDRSEGKLSGNDVEFPELDRAAAFACAFKRCSVPIFKPELISATVDKFSANK